MNDTNREALIKRIHERIAYLLEVGVNDTPILLKEAVVMLEVDAERIAGYKEDQRELMSQMQEMQQEINELKAQQAPPATFQDEVVRLAANELYEFQEATKCDTAAQFKVQQVPVPIGYVLVPIKQPMSESEIYEIYNTYYRPMGPVEFTRAIEEYHGIKGAKP